MASESQRELMEVIGEVPTITPIDPENAEYVKQRRKLLGPSADISHPEFGRENRPEETFRLETTASHPGDNHHQVRIVSKVLDASGENVISEEIYGNGG